MLYQVRTNLFLYYRLFFIALFLLLGISGIGIVMLESYAGINVFNAETEFENEALFSTSLIMGILGFSVGLLMIFLMREKRGTHNDRRTLSKPLDFPDRRAIDRRTN